MKGVEIGPRIPAEPREDNSRPWSRQYAAFLYGLNDEEIGTPPIVELERAADWFDGVLPAMETGADR